LPIKEHGVNKKMEPQIKLGPQLSDKAKKNLQRNEESRRKESKYIKLESGEKRILHFDAVYTNRC
jgi:hypothetical protein